MTTTTWIKTADVEISTGTFISRTQVSCTLPNPGLGYEIEVSIDGGIIWTVGILVLNFDLRCLECNKNGICVQKVSKDK